MQKAFYAHLKGCGVRFPSGLKLNQGFRGRLLRGPRERTQKYARSNTCLMPGLTDTQFFKCAGIEKANAGQMENKAHPPKVGLDQERCISVRG
ncbi:hypothetical protein K3175_13485 [Qipengyuania sp. GH1]|uniref:hypothetical protein n=1 Tax=Qipengyuania aestuarii TaxID=2867241 RepID=UPI001C8796A6|nr:hypothetical protein [Qipengyuania aestuarii]MBX7536674.1 hypothetical protein [Qipengyuania aestuarii]